MAMIVSEVTNCFSQPLFSTERPQKTFVSLVIPQYKFEVECAIEISAVDYKK